MRLRPPDLVIQDELHLITGALGTTVGLFEVAIDVMTTWRMADGSVVKPVIVASTATVRNAADQIRGLYGRRANIFPPRVVDVADTFFSREVAVTPQAPGRRYVGVSPTGVRLTRAEIRLAEVLMATGQLLLDRSGAVADPYLTLVGYFNATRELAGMARYLQDDVRTLLGKGRPGSLLPRRFGTAYGNLHIDELTARVSGADITATLDAMTVPFAPEFDSTDGRMARIQARDRGEKPAERAVNPYDVVLATSMLQVGVDVTRLGLMLVVGQPKNTAEYIQASSRVGRDRARPGLVVTLGNWVRPRDLAHFEAFRHYHETFYARVEPLSVTPFSATSIERGLDGVLVSCARVLTAARADGLSPERSAGRLKANHAFLSDLLAGPRCPGGAGVRRAVRGSGAASGWSTGWTSGTTGATVTGQQGKNLVYEWASDTSKYAPLIRSAESVRADEPPGGQAPFVVANSMREVQPEINLLVSPIPERLFMLEPPSAPRWELPVVADEGGS